jgi:hypothetical protein
MGVGISHRISAGVRLVSVPCKCKTVLLTLQKNLIIKIAAIHCANVDIILILSPRASDRSVKTIFKIHETWPTYHE